jgi:hypothetical protein
VPSIVAWAGEDGVTERREREYTFILGRFAR